MFANSKPTIIKILLLYLGTSAVFLFIGFYYINEKITQNIIFSQMSNLRDISFEIIEIIRKNNNNFKQALPEILVASELPFGIYDGDNNVLFSNLTKEPSKSEFKEGFYKFGNKVIIDPFITPHKKLHIEKLKKRKNLPYRVLLEDDSIEDKIRLMKLKLIGIFVLIFGFMGIVATILVNLFLKPLKNSIKLLDTFIKDSTHEINTPLSIILMSIEQLKKESFSEDGFKKLERIKLASLQLNQIYNALVAYNFPQESIKEELSLDWILKERIDFFMPFLTQKKINLILDINKSSLYADKEKIIILFDNLLSNAIKYNKKGGSIEIALKEYKFIIKDSGSGINNKCINRIYDRYARFSKDSGGFGIGLSLVKKICDEYKIKISLNTNSCGSEFILTWQ
ncbi:HAMP domain-containing sensor histidine kinase [Helicobacter sp. MIT 14-3879]|uniref:sensor histidine kinase n=1 Tax=Helicobacter sp. MIT 14-3879 TaxID=2040649 RepID=UPI000E1F045C|nr:HAMP domain-containing sensor histidine kinase [Helicobacter sp. MIT 14-3879]RDU65476.1 sensor histidine kinase [Helicobacter sp. MIT 14-3879]